MVLNHNITYTVIHIYISAHKN